jgi:hypothetical protein
MSTLSIRHFACLGFSLIAMTVMISIHMMGVGNFQSYLLSRYARISRGAIDRNNIETKTKGIEAGNAYDYDHGLSKKNFDPNLYPNIYKNIVEYSQNNHGQKQNESFYGIKVSPVAHTAMTFSSPQGLHVNLQLHIEILNNQTDSKTDLDSHILSNNDINEVGSNDRDRHRSFCDSNFTNNSEVEESSAGHTGADVAVVFFLPSGCFIDQHEIEVLQLYMHKDVLNLYV